MRTLRVLAFLLAFSTLLAAQGGSQKPRLPAFEVVSVRHNTSGDTVSSARWFPGRFMAVNARLDMLALQAFEIPRGLEHILVAGGLRPDLNCTRNCSSRQDILSARFDIQATIPGDLPVAQQPAVLRAFLEERFKLKAHFEPFDTAVYALTVARDGQLGPRLRRSSVDCGVWAKENTEARARGVSIPSPLDAAGKPLCGVGAMSRLVSELVYVRRSAGDFSMLVNSIRGDVQYLIVDRTGLTGTFEWDLTYAIPGFSELGGNRKQNAPLLEDALQEQLGLRLVRSTGSVQKLVIDSVAMPSPN